MAFISRIKRFFSQLGPGLITGASDDDPSGIATYSQAGAQFGLLPLWTALYAFPLTIAIQEMCARVGIVTGEGLASNIKKHYSKVMLYFVMALSLPAILLNIAADIAAMGAVANLLVPAIHAYWFSLLFTGILMMTMIFLSYEKIVKILKYLCLSLFLYLIIPFLNKQDWLSIFKHSFIPYMQFNKQYFAILLAILGANISPYLFFWQATMQAEKHKNRPTLFVSHRHLERMNVDVGIGMFGANLIMYFIILTTGTILFPQHIHNIATVEQAAKALEPLAGQLSYLVFALGIIGTGFLAIPVFTGCISYVLSSAFNWEGGLKKPFYQAKSFYSVIILSLVMGFGINLIGLNAIQILFYTNLLYGLTSPFLILLILLIANNKRIMGEYRNGALSNALGVIVLFLMTLAALFLIFLYLRGDS
ncbi:Nramp family divalent metal transporter [Legionella jordanis]|uniref:Divalent metal cation transporter MntH n=1 Tax=Legionella jordanis TaxID=456 RepID=A0A0W0VDB9_9GAMM|nr:Nramp family divalent metal transporter [Legionella jordanis]KTD17846.1 Divalent metal cation transporter MntH [Legionella jordanis]RMX02454.1 divalent metal cation transporter [Legionella jordanis]RMX21703.1 divalent metal cation transporter [Legionella jordanis]VEH11217.1 Manganese transport protein MntH [Legionella jordanis]HAT8713815.1 divalent metal cation transporter [Legionella jordanis]